MAFAFAMARTAPAPCETPGQERGVLPVSRGAVILAGASLVLAALAAYHNSFSGPFIWDDLFSITGNPTIRHWSRALFPPSDVGVGGRPVSNLTLALNYALGGTDVWGYHPEVASRTVDTHIKRLRDKLDTAADLLQTVRGVGFRLADSAGPQGASDDSDSKNVGSSEQPRY